ncbi:MAG: tyrosine-type recombinase/integrase [Candidatus Binataceae bacterium]
MNRLPQILRFCLHSGARDAGRDTSGKKQGFSTVFVSALSLTLRAAPRQPPAGGRSFVFSNEHDRPVDLALIRRRWAKALEAAGLPYQKLHSLRHTFCTLALASGYTAQETAAACGHASIAQILKTYAPPRGPESAARLEAYLSGGQITAG